YGLLRVANRHDLRPHVHIRQVRPPRRRTRKLPPHQSATYDSETYSFHYSVSSSLFREHRWTRTSTDQHGREETGSMNNNSWPSSGSLGESGVVCQNETSSPSQCAIVNERSGYACLRPSLRAST